ncbi:MAG: hypothetical protein H6733_13110 [Alphaproteobacteria bacterium]|nr:hypothetical protein [Alphaproteobacteria bacterium]
MDVFVNAVAIVSLTGVVGVAVCGGAVGVGMPLLLLAGLLDGPTGGRLSRAERATSSPGPAPVPEELDDRAAAPRPTA